MYIRLITLSNGVLSYAFQLRRSSLEFSALNFVLLWVTLRGTSKREDGLLIGYLLLFMGVDTCAYSASLGDGVHGCYW